MLSVITGKDDCAVQRHQDPEKTTAAPRDRLAPRSAHVRAPPAYRDVIVHVYVPASDVDGVGLGGSADSGTRGKACL